MPAPFRRLSVAEFAELLARFPFTRRVNQVHMHHTWSPNHREWRGLASVQAMRDFHVRTNGWSDIAQHITIAPDGGIWTGRNWNQAPASSGGFNGTSAVGPFMFETVGNFDVGRDPFAGAQRDAVLEVIARVQLRFGLPAESLHFHRQLNSPKTCPGSGIAYEATLDAVRAVRKRLAAAAPRDLAARAPFGDDAFAATDLARELAAARVDREDPADAELLEEHGPPAYAEQMRGEAAAAAAPNGAGGTGATRSGAAKAPALSPAQLRALRPHVVNLCQGTWSTDGAYQTSQADADAIADEHLPQALAAARAEGRPLRVLVFAHGGLVDEASGLGVAHKQCAWWAANGVYPLFFVWETGLAGTVKQLLTEARRRLPLVGTRDLWDRTTDPLVETAARALGGAKVWGGMKWSAERASAPGGGARHVAERLGAFAAAANAAHPGSVTLHAVGHSAGSIFHAHFLPRLLEAMGEGGRVDSLDLLAPAARTDLYAAALQPLVEDGRIGRCTMATMAVDWEKADHCNGVYRKSLLYLVSRAFERERPASILGLEESVRGDARLRAHFGLAGARGAADVAWARSEAGASPLAATTSTSHGGFDDDAPTMEAVLRRVLGDVDGTRRIRPFPVTRAVSMDEAADAWPEELAWAAAVAGGAPAPSAMPTAVPTAVPAAPADPFAGGHTADLAAQIAHDDAGAGEDVGVEGEVEDDAGEAAGEPAADGARPLDGPLTASRRGRRRALCVGIDTYPAAPLHGCVADARLWQRTLREQLGFDDVALLTDAQATRAGILQALGDLLRTSRRGDVVVFQYAGHGTTVPDVDRDEGDANDEALVPVDYAGGAFLVDDDLRAAFDRTPAGVAVTCFMDCCHSGTITRVLAGGPPAPRADAGDGPRARYLDLLSQAPEALAAYVALRLGAPAGETPDGARAVGGTAAGTREAMRTVLYSACLSTEVAYEQNGQGDFTRLATPLLRDAVRDAATHVEFRRRVIAAFGATPRQHPTLDCAPSRRTGRLLHPVAAPAARAAEAAEAAESAAAP